MCETIRTRNAVYAIRTGRSLTTNLNLLRRRARPRPSCYPSDFETVGVAVRFTSVTSSNTLQRLCVFLRMDFELRKNGEAADTPAGFQFEIQTRWKGRA